MKLLLCLAMLQASCTAFTAPTLSATPEEVDTAHRRAFLGVVSLVRDDLGNSYCSGAVVENKIVTAYHCVADVKPHSPVSFGLYADYDYERNVWLVLRTAEVKVTMVEQDLALLEIHNFEGIPQGHIRSFPLSTLDPFLAQEVYAFGHPMGFGYYVSRGTVIAPLRRGGVHPAQLWLQHTASIYPGMSGGPLVTHSGHLVGINVFAVHGREHLGGAARWKEVRELLDQW